MSRGVSWSPGRRRPLHLRQLCSPYPKMSGVGICLGLASRSMPWPPRDRLHHGGPGDRGRAVALQMWTRDLGGLGRVEPPRPELARLGCALVAGELQSTPVGHLERDDVPVGRDGQQRRLGRASCVSEGVEKGGALLAWSSRDPGRVPFDERAPARGDRKDLVAVVLNHVPEGVESSLVSTDEVYQQRMGAGVAGLEPFFVVRRKKLHHDPPSGCPRVHHNILSMREGCQLNRRLVSVVWGSTSGGSRRVSCFGTACVVLATSLDTRREQRPGRRTASRALPCVARRSAGRPAARGASRLTCWIAWVDLASLPSGPALSWSHLEVCR